jgi:hypothetical protein
MEHLVDDGVELIAEVGRAICATTHTHVSDSEQGLEETCTVSPQQRAGTRTLCRCKVVGAEVDAAGDGPSVLVELASACTQSSASSSDHQEHVRSTIACAAI